MELDTILNIMAKYKLTADELLLVYLSYIACSENGNSDQNRKYFVKWYNGGGSERLRSLFESLKEKGVILKNYSPQMYDPEEVEFNKNFLKQYYKLSGELGQDLLKHYPKTLYLNGKIIYLDNVTKRFQDYPEFYFWYASTIGHSIEKHKEIIEILEWAKTQDLVSIPVIEFIGSRKWETFKELKQNGVKGQASTFDIYENA